MTFPRLDEIQQAVATGRIQSLPASTLEEYLETLAVTHSVDEETLTRMKDAVREELQRRQARVLSRRNALAGVIGAAGALIAALALLKRCH